MCVIIFVTPYPVLLHGLVKRLELFKDRRLKITIIIIIIIRTARKKNHQTRRPVTGPNHHQAVCDFYTGGDRISKYPMGPRLCEARDITDRIYFG